MMDFFRRLSKEKKRKALDLRWHNMEMRYNIPKRILEQICRDCAVACIMEAELKKEDRK